MWPSATACCTASALADATDACSRRRALRRHRPGARLRQRRPGEVQRILGRQYHAVVGNPPYIVVKDAALNAAYRKRYASCHMKYSLGAPFTERFFELALTGRDGQARLRRPDHRQLVHEARVRQQADRAGAAAAGPDPCGRHLGRLHPGATARRRSSCSAATARRWATPCAR
ncbi:Eco57I restriction-modification methylase domain-containing protein [Candidatus Accumulibacter necessarius]|uniref:Eco57I restriction-modification methylase domain-containing protein n=1 Tax=Candidatus Accumulibacter necessarius TaxID=2954386 RepID=UPI003DA88807